MDQRKGCAPCRAQVPGHVVLRERAGDGSVANTWVMKPSAYTRARLVRWSERADTVVLAGLGEASSSALIGLHGPDSQLEVEVMATKVLDIIRAEPASSRLVVVGNWKAASQCGRRGQEAASGGGGGCLRR